MKKIIFSLITLFISLVPTFSQSLNLPMTWQTPVPGGYMVATLHEDGSFTSCTQLGCFNCNGYGICGACSGSGGIVWGYGMGMMPCSACGGTGRCGACQGKGYSVFNATTQYGVTVVIDDSGKSYVMGAGGAAAPPASTRSKSRDKVEVIEYTATYGVSANENVYCSKCGKTMARHVHVLK